MKGFTPVKKRAKQFNYIPRYYDPQKDAREERLAELRGVRSSTDEREYKPGDYIRTKSEARLNRKERESQGGSRSTTFMIMGVVLLFLFGYMILPRIISAFEIGGAKTEKKAPINEYEEFDPYAPLRVIPND